jgi:hypothetical protein
MRRLGLFLGFILFGSAGISKADDVVTDKPNGRNVFVITIDGFRWQELFYGADESILESDPAAEIRPITAGTTIQERRRQLMPFVWSTIASQGQLYGDRRRGNAVNIENFYALSYPGYNEIFTGATDAFISTNKKIQNRNKNVLEFLNTIPEYSGRVASFTSWDAFPFIFNAERSGVYVNSAFQKLQSGPLTGTEQVINKILQNPLLSRGSVRNDLLTALAAKEYILSHLPKVVHIGLGGTDEAAHDKDYGRYLDEASRADEIIGELWKMVEAHPYYRGNTTFIITTDHGRGSSPQTWHSHGMLTRGSFDTWVMLLGKGIAPVPEEQKPPQLYQRQIAGTVGYLLGLPSYCKKTLPLHLLQ